VSYKELPCNVSFVIIPRIGGSLLSREKEGELAEDWVMGPSEIYF
jgi:hypothetical protein